MGEISAMAGERGGVPTVGVNFWREVFFFSLPSV